MSGATLGICLALAGSAQETGDAPVFVAAQRFTLAWTHSIERVRWEEDYEVRAATVNGEPVLHALMSRVRGSAAGMEPGPDAVLCDGWYHYLHRRLRAVPAGRGLPAAGSLAAQRRLAHASNALPRRAVA